MHGMNRYYTLCIASKLIKRPNNMLIANKTTPIIFYIGLLANNHFLYFSVFIAAFRGIEYTENNSIGYLFQK